MLADPPKKTTKPTASSKQPRKRLIEIDKATGLAIILVVVGHIVAREPPAGNQWYEALKHYIYTFHMPFFMFLSGVVFFHTFTAPLNNLADYKQWAGKKIFRLAPGFLLFGFITIVGKLLASHFMHVDNLQNDVLHSVIRLFILPAESPAGSLWYIYVLLELYLLVPLFLWVFGMRIWPVVVVAIPAHVAWLCYDIPGYFMLHLVAEYLLWFSLGACFQTRYEPGIRFLQKFRWLFYSLFLSSLLLAGSVPAELVKTIISACAIPALLAFTAGLSGHISNWLLKVSAYTYCIYLMNPLTIGVTKGLLLQLIPWDGMNFLFYFPVLFFAGLIGPILIYRFVFAHNPILAKITR